MAQDIAPDLLEAIRRDFVRNLGGSKRAAELLEAIQSGRAGYAEAGEYAEEVGRALSEAFQSNLSGDTLPDGRMYWNLADRVIRPLLEEDHALASEAARQVQQQLNEAAGIGIKAQSVPLDQDRVDGILNRLAAAEQYEAVAWLLGEPVILFSRSVVDESVRRNAEFQGEAGLTPRIIRRAESHCCEWCAKLAGTYTYPNVPKDVYRRHDFCRCVVEYDPGDGKRQTVHSGQEGKRRYVQDGYGGYEETREARIQRAQEMAATADERAKAAREKRITTWAKKKKDKWTADESSAMIEARKTIGIGTTQRQFQSQELFTKHFEKHQAEYGTISTQEYLRQATLLADAELSDDVVQLIRSDNSIAKYRFSTNDFLVLNEDGTIRTFFKPKSREAYWQNELDRN